MTDTARVLIVSSDGHVSAEMDDYRPYVPAEYLERFDDFCREFREKGSRNYEAAALGKRLDSDVLEQWQREVLDPGRFRGMSDLGARRIELEQQGITAEVLR